MSDTIPSDSHSIGDTGHVTDHNNLADVVGLMASVLAQMGTGMGQGNGWQNDPAGNANNIATINAMQGIMYAPTVFFDSIDHTITGTVTGANVGTISTGVDMIALTVGNSYLIECEFSYEPLSGSAGTAVTPIIQWSGGTGAATDYSFWGEQYVTGAATAGATVTTNLYRLAAQTTNLPFSFAGPNMVSGQKNVYRMRGLITGVTTADVPVLRITTASGGSNTVTVHSPFIRVSPSWQE